MKKIKSDLVDLNDTDFNSDEIVFITTCDKPSITALTGKYIMTFSEKTYEDSLKMMFEYVKEQNRENTEREKNDVKRCYIIEVVDFYAQKHKSKAVLVSYNMKTRPDTNIKES